MKVKELIAILQTMPQDATVVALDGKGDTCEITKAGVQLMEKGKFHYYTAKGNRVNKEHVDIIGF